MRTALRFGLLLTALLWNSGEAGAADLTVKQVVEALVKASPEQPADFAGRDLSLLDLSDIDFKKANLAGADLYGTDISHSNLSGTNLSGARLDRSVIIGADFAGANMSQASLLRPAAFSSFDILPVEAPRFVGANLAGARLFGRFSKADWHGANLAMAQMGADRSTDIGLRNLSRTELAGCDLAGARLSGADLRGALLTFANLRGADLSGSNLTRADLSRADLSGANLTGADLTGSDLDGTILRGVAGLLSVHGLDTAHNRDKAIE